MPDRRSGTATEPPLLGAAPLFHQAFRLGSCPTIKRQGHLRRSLRVASHSITQGDIVYAVDMGRRGRQRSEQARIHAAAPVDRMARVHVSDETWVAFRAQLGITPVSVGLGRLVERSVAQESRRSASDPQGVRVAIDDARTVAKELESLIARLERTQQTKTGNDG
jgi:hypothetical protein